MIKNIFISIFGLIHFIYSLLPPPKQILFFILITPIIFIVITNSIIKNKEIKFFKDYTPEYFQKYSEYFSNKNCYILNEDPHKFYLGFLFNNKYKEISINDIKKTINDENDILIIGPYGNNSGKSLGKHGTLPDLQISNEIINYLEKKTNLPFWINFPFFLFEEEVCQGLYFENKTPNYKMENYNITLLTKKK